MLLSAGCEKEEVPQEKETSQEGFQEEEARIFQEEARQKEEGQEVQETRQEEISQEGP